MIRICDLCKTEDFFLYGLEKDQNSLVANTRCEVCVIEIGEIAKSIPLLKKLIEMTNYSYPQLLIQNEEIIYNYYKDILTKICEIANKNKDKIKGYSKSIPFLFSNFFNKTIPGKFSSYHFNRVNLFGTA